MPVSNKSDIKRFYQALLRRDSQFAGVFYVGVTTTRVFCIATCRARKPKPENVIFFTTHEEAIFHGFRPCKVCRPLEDFSKAPEDIQSLINLVNGNPEKKISDNDLRMLGHSPEKIRRWFKKHHGLTFQVYQRMIRVNFAFQDLRKGAKVTESAFDSGYESLSGFGYTFKNLLGIAPENARKTNVIHLMRLTTPLGPMLAGATEKGICLLEFADRSVLSQELKELSRLLDAVIIFGINRHLTKVASEIKEYFEGARKEFDVSLVSPGTGFQQKVWHHLQDIPFGEVRTYKQQATLMQQPNAIRAVGRANGHNRISIIIPCHRVMGANGDLRGYGGGISRKKWLLAHESSLSGKANT